MVALGETAGAACPAQAEIQRYAAARGRRHGAAHGFSGSGPSTTTRCGPRDLTAEAGLSFFHLHAEGVGWSLFFASTLVAATVPWRRARPPLSGADARRALSPGLSRVRAAVLEIGATPDRDGRAQVLTPLGVSAIVGLLACCSSRRADAHDGSRVRGLARSARWSLLVAVLSIVTAEVGGASMARFKVELTRWAATRCWPGPRSTASSGSAT